MMQCINGVVHEIDASLTRQMLTPIILGSVLCTLFND